VVRKRGREGARHELVGETSMDCASCFGVSAEAEVGGGEHGGGGVYSVPMGADNAEADRIGSADSSQERGREKEGSEGGRFGVGVAPLVGLVGLGKQRRAGGGDSGGDGLSEDVECAICMEVIASWETVKLPCCHRFCASCVGEIYSGRNATRDTQGKSTSKKCPLCRAQPPWWWWWWWWAAPIPMRILFAIGSASTFIVTALVLYGIYLAVTMLPPTLMLMLIGGGGASFLALSLLLYLS